MSPVAAAHSTLGRPARDAARPRPRHPRRPRPTGRFARWLSLSAGLAVAASCAGGAQLTIAPKVDCCAPTTKEAGGLGSPASPGDRVEARGPWVGDIRGRCIEPTRSAQSIFRTRTVKAAAAAFDQARGAGGAGARGVFLADRVGQGVLAHNTAKRAPGKWHRPCRSRPNSRTSTTNSAGLSGQLGL